MADRDEYYLGCEASDQVLDDKDKDVAMIDRGLGVVRDQNGSTIFEIDGYCLFTDILLVFMFLRHFSLFFDRQGYCKGHTEVYLGQFVGCGYRELTWIALYVLFLDPHFAREDVDF